MMRTVVLLLVSLCLGRAAWGYDLKLRAREHFDTLDITYGEKALTYQHTGIGPSINLWLEEPYVAYFGLVYDMTYIRNDGRTAYGQGAKDSGLWRTGLEVKYFLFPTKGGPFGRLGIANYRLQSWGAFEEAFGTGNYVGVGYEIKFSRIGLAFEMAQGGST